MLQHIAAALTNWTRAIRSAGLIPLLAIGISAATALGFLARAAIERRALFYSNQNTYFPPGLARAGREYLQADWFAGTRPPHLAFTYLIEALDRLRILEGGVAVVQALLEAALLVAIWLIAAGIHRRLIGTGSGGLRVDTWPALATASFALVLLGMKHASFLRERLEAWTGADWQDLGSIWEQTFLFSALASQYIWGRYLQPSEFGILILLAIGVMLFERWRLGGLLCGLAVVMHTGYLPHAGLLMLATAGWLYHNGRRRPAVEMLAIFGICALPVAIYALTFTFQPGRAEALDILANFRTPHHSQPERWWTDIARGQIALIGIAALLALWRRVAFLGWIMAAGFVYTVAGIVAVWYVVDSDGLAFSFPWRGTVYLIPLSLFIITAFVVTGVARLLQFAGRRHWLVPAVAAILGLYVLYSTGSDALDAQPQSDDVQDPDAVAMVQQMTGPEDVIMIPEGWEYFRLDARRPIYIDFKSHPYEPPEVLEWRRRVQVNRRFYTGDRERRDEICRAEPFDFYIVERGVEVAPHRVVAERGEFRLAACPDS